METIPYIYNYGLWYLYSNYSHWGLYYKPTNIHITTGGLTYYRFVALGCFGPLGSALGSSWSRKSPGSWEKRPWWTVSLLSNARRNGMWRQCTVKRSEICLIWKYIWNDLKNLKSFLFHISEYIWFEDFEAMLVNRNVSKLKLLSEVRLALSGREQRLLRGSGWWLGATACHHWPTICTMWGPRPRYPLVMSK